MPERLTMIRQAFVELQTERPVGMGLFPIPWSSIHHFARAKGIRGVDRFEHLIRSMDAAFLAAHRKRKAGKNA